jgi:hypothetical protein
MHFSPISLISSAVRTACILSPDAVARLNSSVSDSGEFIVIVAAVCVHRISERSVGELIDGLTDKVSHESRPTFLLLASCLNRSYTDRTWGEAGRVFGRANGALMSAFNADDNFDISNILSRCNQAAKIVSLVARRLKDI